MNTLNFKIVSNLKMKKTITLTALLHNFSRIIKDIGSKFEFYTITKRGKPVAVMMNPLHYKLLLEITEMRSNRKIRKNKTISFNEFNSPKANRKVQHMQQIHQNSEKQ